MNGEEALARLAAIGPLPCVVLLDLMMPILTGEAVLAEMSKHPRLRALPVVVTTASPQRPAGAVAYLRKPFGIDSLLNTVRTYC